MAWDCNGEMASGDISRAHDLVENINGSFCPSCGLSQSETQANKRQSVTTMLLPKNDRSDRSGNSPIVKIALLLVAGVAVLGAGGYFALKSQLLSAIFPPGNSGQPTTEPAGSVGGISEPENPGFAKQADTRYGISIEYPDQWKLKKPKKDYPPSALTGTKDLFQIFPPTSSSGTDSYRPEILVKIEQVVDTRFIDEYSDQQVSRITQLGTYQIESDRPVPMGDKSAREIIYSGNNGEYRLKRKRWIIEPQEASNYFFLVTYTAEEDDYEKHISEVDKVFKSIDLQG